MAEKHGTNKGKKTDEKFGEPLPEFSSKSRSSSS
jgi:hypothetical protein